MPAGKVVAGLDACPLGEQGDVFAMRVQHLNAGKPRFVALGDFGIVAAGDRQAVEVDAQIAGLQRTA